MTNQPLCQRCVKIKRHLGDTERFEEGTQGGSGLLKIGFAGLWGAERDSVRGLVLHFLSSTSRQYQHQQISWPKPVTGQINGSSSSLPFYHPCCQLQITDFSLSQPPSHIHRFSPHAHSSVCEYTIFAEK